MICKLIELRDKEVINIKNGFRMGYVNDIEIDTVTGNIVSLVVYGKSKLMGLLGREDDMIIRWEDIDVIGDDTILVCGDTYFPPKKKKEGLIKSVWN